MMKRIILVAMVLSLSVSGLAQIKKEKKMESMHDSKSVMDHDNQEARAMIYADKMATRLSLNLEQKEKIREAHLKRLENEKDLKTAMLNSKDSMIEEKKDMMEQRKQIQQDFKDDMKAILNANQFSRWKGMHEREMKMNEKAYKLKKNKGDKIE
ncbi:hypothetical protein [Christiangramia sabulilitoris]|uniref:Periplasmic heavy metal sensor n=1 Tax=Christiangramia sabulilitoris TaxID=2583991 RepID=A0A550I7V0_9FLAO|nr:hypothetical protein [Christiangramia sabulilitoris]TRO67050.1 hypothetical protein FGM01_03960 [Christiangramia sabulilitoris]